MPNTETVRALVSAFNINNYDFNAVKTNFTLQSNGTGSYIVVSFDEGMNRYQCQKYLDSIKRKIIREFYGIEESNDAEILDTAKLIFDVNSFPFNMKGKWSQNEQGRIEFLAPIDKGVIFNLKSHLASSLEKDILEDMRVGSTTVPFNKKEYLCCSKFPNKQLCEEFEREFLFRMRERYENVPKDPLKVKGNSVYIKDVFDDARFIDSITQRTVWLVGRDLQADSKSRSDVRAFKDLIIEFINQSIGLTVAGFVCDFPLGKEEATVFTPVVLDNRESRVLASKEALKLNYAFNGAVFYDLYGRTQGELSINGSSGIYSIDFSNPEISHCVITKIIESSVINKDHELSIDPGLRFRALSRSPSTELSDVLGFPTRSQDKELKPRQGSEREGLLYNQLGLAGTSGRPSTRMNSTAVDRVIEPGKCAGAAENVPAGTSAWSQPMDPWSFPVPPAHFPSSGSVPGLRPLVGGPSSCNESGSAWPSTCTQNTCSSSEDANESIRTGKSTWYVPSSHSPDVEDVNGVEPEEQQVSDKSSEAKPQESKSLKKQVGAFVRSFSLNFERRGAIKRNGAGRGTTRSTPETPVTEKPPVSKSSSSFPGRIRAESNPPPGVTSPTHEGGSEWQQRLNPDQREELHPFLSPEEQKKLDSNSFSPGEERLLYLTHALEGKRELSRSLCEGKESQLRRLAEVQLSSPDNSSSKKVDRDSGFCSMGSPAVLHRGNVSSECKECSVQQAKYMSKVLEKN